MTQKDDSGSSFKGKNFIGWMVARQQGKIMAKVDKRALMKKAGISDLKVLSSEIEPCEGCLLANGPRSSAATSTSTATDGCAARSSGLTPPPPS